MEVSHTRVGLKTVKFYTMKLIMGERRRSVDNQLLCFTKRFSQFLILHYDVQQWYHKRYPEIKLPPPPPKHRFSVFSSSEFLNQRKTELERYIFALGGVKWMHNCTPFLEFVNANARNGPGVRVLPAGH